MKYSKNNWPFRWIGFWQEYGVEYIDYPSVWDFVDYEINSHYDKVRLIEYLNNGMLLIITSSTGFPSPFDGKVKCESFSFKTDGYYIWSNNISDFIQKNDLILPSGWYDRIVNNNFITPVMSEGDFYNLEMPSL